MSKYIMPSKWGMKLIDLIVVLVLIAILVRFLAPTSGLSQAIHTFTHLLAGFIGWLAGVTVQFLNWI